MNPHDKTLLTEMIRLASAQPETREHLLPLIRTARDNDLEEQDAIRMACQCFPKMTAQKWAGLTNPEKLSVMRRVAHQPIMKSQGFNKGLVRSGEAFMVYNIDPKTNKSKFYEGMVVPADGGGFRVVRRWGALTDSGRTGRIDGAKWDEDRRFWFDDVSSAKRELSKHYAKRLSRGYIDAFGPKHINPMDGKKLPMGQYPVGLTREVGFGWGSQSVTTCIPGLRQLQEQIAAAQVEIAGKGRSDTVVSALESAIQFIRTIAHEDSSMAGKLLRQMGKPLRRAQGSPRFLPDPEGKALTKELNTISRYVEKQLSYCS